MTFREMLQLFRRGFNDADVGVFLLGMGFFVGVISNYGSSLGELSGGAIDAAIVYFAVSCLVGFNAILENICAPSRELANKNNANHVNLVANKFANAMKLCSKPLQNIAEKEASQNGYICRITFELMDDPVQLTYVDGYKHKKNAMNYNRTTMLDNFNTNGYWCPLTRKKVTKVLRPNEPFRQEILSFVMKWEKKSKNHTKEARIVRKNSSNSPSPKKEVKTPTILSTQTNSFLTPASAPGIRRRQSGHYKLPTQNYNSRLLKTFKK